MEIAFLYPFKQVVTSMRQTVEIRGFRFTMLACVAPMAMAYHGSAVAADTASTPDDVQLDTIVVSATMGAYQADGKDTASAVAPTRASLQATQPQSIITREFIEQAVAPTAEYSRVVVIAPSLSGDSTNGPGLSETKITLRGFSDDQYNITFDGIPFGDTNNPAHHSTSFFPASVIGSAIVERGPGNASNIGYATFGGSINLFSKKPSDQGAMNVFASFGTWNTQLYGASWESGRLDDYNDTVQFNFQRLESDGYLTLNHIKSDNYTGKFERTIGDSTLTVFSSVNTILYVQPDNSSGPTLAQVAKYGKNYSLNNDPTSFNYAGFNHTAKDTDFEYLRLQTEWGAGWSTDARVYTYAYDNQTISSTDPTGLTNPGTKAAPTGNKDIPGIDKQNKYRVYGTILNAEKQFGIGVLRGGVWYERSASDRHQYDLDLTLNVRDPRETKPTPLQLPSVKFDQISHIVSSQPYVEFEWAAAQGLTVTPGFKSVSITRSVDAVINQTSRLPANFSVDYSKSLPFLTVNKRLSQGLAVYAQAAQGYQIPDLKTLYILDPTKNSSDPQTSTNYQVGIVGKARSLTWDVDLYRIDFKNKYVSNGKTGADAAYLNIGGAQYEGMEGQVTYLLGGGLAVYANGSINRAKALDTGKQISGAPDMTAGLGALWSRGPWATSLIYKRTGETHQQEYSASPSTYEAYKVAARDNTDLGVTYTMTNLALGAKVLKLQFNVFNLMGREDITSISVGSTVPANQYQFQAPRSMQISARAQF